MRKPDADDVSIMEVSTWISRASEKDLNVVFGAFAARIGVDQMYKLAQDRILAARTRATKVRDAGRLTREDEALAIHEMKERRKREQAEALAAAEAIEQAPPVVLIPTTPPKK